MNPRRPTGEIIVWGPTDEIIALRKELKISQTKLKVYEGALNRSEYDISPCRECGLPVVCIPDGMSAMCSVCWKKEARE